MTTTIRPVEHSGDWDYEPGCGCAKCEVVTYGSPDEFDFIARRADR